jgi:regulator of protease activity HflC (stomatin/prohibitin superfamily)
VNGAVLVMLIVTAFVGVMLFRSVRIVPQQTAEIVERFGRYQRTLSAGINLIVPLIDLVWKRVDLREQAVSVPPAPVITADGHKVTADVLVHYLVTDPVAAVYEIGDVRTGIEQLVVTSLRAALADRDLDHTSALRRELRDMLREVFDEAAEKWGIQVTYIEVKSIERDSDER